MGTEAEESAERVFRGGTFSVEKFVESFPVLVEATGGADRLKGLVIEIAIRGRLSDPAATDEPVDRQMARVLHEKSVSSRNSSTEDTPMVETIPFDVPSHWRWVRWRDLVLSTGSGWSPQCENRPREDREWGVLKVSAVSWLVFQPEENKALPAGIEPRVEFAAHSGDFLMSRANTADLVGRSVIVAEEPTRLLLSDKLVRCKFSKEVEQRYVNLYNRTTTARAHYLANASGTSDSMKNISRDVILSMPLPLPPLAEQKRIVARVDQLMALIDQLEAKQNRKRDLGARYTKASLEALTTAESPQDFTTAWTRILQNWEVHFRGEENVANLRALCLWMGLTGRIGASSVDPKDWDATTLGRISSFVTSGSRGWKEYYATLGAVFIRSQDIKTDSLDLTAPVYVALPEGVEGSRTRVQRDDLLVTITGANVGKAAHVRNDPPEAYVSQHVALIRLAEPRFAPWVHHWLVSPHNGRKTLSGFTYGDKPGLNLDNIRGLPILLPPLAEQKRIVAKVEHLMKLCDALEAALRRREDRAAKLAEAVVQEMVA